MSRLRSGLIVLSALAMLGATGASFSAEAQLSRLRRAARNALEREVARQVDRAVTGMVRCAFNDPACIEKAEEDGESVEITDEDGNVLLDANGNPISDADYAEASRQKPGEGAWRNYDFVPGDRTLFYEDYTNDNVGDFPRRLEFLSGNMEIVDSDGLRILRVSGGNRDAQFAIPLPETLPEQFTLEFPVHWASRNLYARVYFEADGARVPPAGGNYQLQHLVVDHRYTGIYDWQQDGPTSTQAVPQIHKGWVTVRLMADGEHVKAYINEKRVANVPQAQLGRDTKIWFSLRDPTEDVPIYLGAISVAAGGRDLYDRLAAEGTVTTRGILFNTDSDEILPESTPTLKEIGEMLRDHDDLRLGIAGHTDSQGADDYNLELSDRRATSVKRYLTEEFDIDPARLESQGLGESMPIDMNDTPEGRSSNRRVELTDLRADAGRGGVEAASSAQENARVQNAEATTTPPAPATTAPVTSASRGGSANAANGEITIILDGESRTLPILATEPPAAGATGRAFSDWMSVSSRWSPPFTEFDGPQATSVFLRAGALGDGQPYASIYIKIDREQRAVSRGRSSIVDSRANGVRPAAMDAASASNTRVTLEEYEIRGASAYVRGSFTAPAGDVNGSTGAMNGTFWALVPALCMARRDHPEWGDPTPSAEGCYPCELIAQVDEFTSVAECRRLAALSTASEPSTSSGVLPVPFPR